MKKITLINIGYYILSTIKGILSSWFILGTQNIENNNCVKLLQTPSEVALAVPSLDLNQIQGLTDDMFISTVDEPLRVFRDINFKPCIEARNSTHCAAIFHHISSKNGKLIYIMTTFYQIDKTRQWSSWLTYSKLLMGLKPREILDLFSLNCSTPSIGSTYNKNHVIHGLMQSIVYPW